MNAVQVEQSYQLLDDRRKYVPQNFEAYACISTSADFDVTGILVARLSWANFPTLVWRFQKGRKVIYAVRPVKVNISRGESLYFAENEKLGIFVTGESPQEANRAFEEEVVHFYDHYKSLSSEEVTGEAQKLKGLYSRWFKEANG